MKIPPSFEVKRRENAQFRWAFTIVELLVVVIVIGVLSVLSLGVAGRIKESANAAVCTLSLRQLASATTLYASDHEMRFPRYREASVDGIRWYFGFEPAGSGGGEGNRDLDVTLGPLYPYVESVGKVEICPSFNYQHALWKPKYKGASWGYGYNWRLGGRISEEPKTLSQISDSSQVILFGDCAQVNTMQAPASASNPMLEEFYLVDEKEITVHFRHQGKANFVFLDGHVEALSPEPGTLDPRIEREKVGRITPRGSLKFLE